MKKVAFFAILAVMFSFNASAYMFQFKNLGTDDDARFEKRIEQGMTIIKLLNEADDKTEIQKSGVSISYELNYGSNLTWTESNVKIKRTVLDKEGMFKYACLYLVKGEMAAKLSVSLTKCASEGLLE